MAAVLDATKNPDATKLHPHANHSPKRTHAPPADLTFAIAGGMLTGTAGGEAVKMPAFSGGRGGSTTKGAVDAGVVNNPDKVGQKTDHRHHVHGGPLPPGTYTIGVPSRHAHLGLSAALTPHTGNHMLGRAGFFIHGSGPHGSDGCIVPAAAADFHRLMHLLTTSHGGTLTVVHG